MIEMNEMTISKFHHALSKDPSLGPALITSCLNAIKNHDQSLKSIITLNPEALNEAIKQSSQTTPFQPLHSIPIILKDNFTTPNLPTTAGVKALSIQTTKESTIISRLRKAGAIIIAKANLHEFALQGITLSSIKGQTLNPYDPSRTPGGSSGGTGAALAAGFAMLGCGTDTVNSLRSPASACGVVGFRPSTGVIPCDGVVPVSSTQDVAGPMGLCVADVRILYAVMAGVDVPSISIPVSGSVRRRVGVLESYFHSDTNKEENLIVQDVVRRALDCMGDHDVDLVPIPEIAHGDWGFDTLVACADTQAFEFKQCLEEFLNSDVDSVHRSLDSIVRSGEYSREAVTDVFTAASLDPGTYSMSSEAYLERLRCIETLKASVDRCFEEYRLDALVYPHQRQLPVRVGERKQGGRNGILAALTGRPAICIPAGRSPPTETAVEGIPIGVEFMGKRWGDDKLLDLAEHVESVLQVRQAPDLGVFQKYRDE